MPSDVELEGFYVAYITGVQTEGVVLMVFRDGEVVGADMGGVCYDGSYSYISETGDLKLRFTAQVPPNIMLVQGRTSPPDGEVFSGEAVIPLRQNVPYVRVETPHGPVNVKLQKIRSLQPEGRV